MVAGASMGKTADWSAPPQLARESLSAEITSSGSLDWYWSSRPAVRAKANYRDHGSYQINERQLNDR